MTEANQTTEPENAQQTFTYRVVRGSIRRPRTDKSRSFVSRSDFFNQGDLIPDGTYGEDDIQSWLADGRIERAVVSEEMAEEARAIAARGVWTVDPSTLVGKTMEDLLLMVADIDPEFDTDSLEDEQAAVRLLTSDWDPRYAQTVPAANDRSKPAVINLNHLEQTETETATRSSNRPPSESSKDALARARAKAAAPVAEADQE